MVIAFAVFKGTLKTGVKKPSPMDGPPSKPVTISCAALMFVRKSSAPRPQQARRIGVRWFTFVPPRESKSPAHGFPHAGDWVENSYFVVFVEVVVVSAGSSPSLPALGA